MKQYVVGRGAAGIGGERSFTDDEIMEECARTLGTAYPAEAAHAVGTIISHRYGEEATLARQEALARLPQFVWFNRKSGKATLDPESEALELCTWCNDVVYEEAILCPNCWGVGLFVREEAYDNFIEVNVSDVFSFPNQDRIRLR